MAYGLPLVRAVLRDLHRIQRSNSMPRMSNVLPIVLVAMLLMAIPSFAANAHFVAGPTCTQVNSTQLACSGKIAGLGNLPIYLVINAPAGCTTPSGSNNPPGQQ